MGLKVKEIGAVVSKRKKKLNLSDWKGPQCISQVSNLLLKARWALNLGRILSNWVLKISVYGVCSTPLGNGCNSCTNLGRIFCFHFIKKLLFPFVLLHSAVKSLAPSLSVLDRGLSSLRSLQAEQAPVSQPLLAGQVLQRPEALGGPRLIQFVSAFLVLTDPELIYAWSSKCSVWRETNAFLNLLVEVLQIQSYMFFVSCLCCWAEHVFLSLSLL